MPGGPALTSPHGHLAPRHLTPTAHRGSALRHTPPAASSIEWSAAQRTSLAAPLGRSPAARAVREELAVATPEEAQAEVSQLFRSVSGAQLLLAGALDAQTAAGLASAVRREVQQVKKKLNTILNVLEDVEKDEEYMETVEAPVMK